jgi:hypothetical protein
MVSKLEEVVNMSQMVKCHVVLRIPWDSSESCRTLWGTDKYCTVTLLKNLLALSDGYNISYQCHRVSGVLVSKKKNVFLVQFSHGGTVYMVCEHFQIW